MCSENGLGMEKKQVIVQKLKTVITVLGRLLAVLSIVFVIYSLYKIDIDWSYFSHPYVIFLDVLGLSLLVVLYSYINAYIWKLYLDFFSGVHTPAYEVIIIYLKSNIAKYLPGNVIQYVGRNMLGKKLEIGQKSIVMATVAELVSLVCGNIIFALVMSLQNTKSVVGRLWVEHNMKKSLAVIAVLGIAIIIIGVIYLVKNDFRRKIKNYINKDNIKKIIRLFCIVFILYTIVFLVSALILRGIFYILNADISFANVASANALSWLAGYIVPGAPGGIGIREVVLVWLLEAECLPEMVILAAVLLRICVILGDFLSFLGAVFMDGLKRRKETGNA